MLNSEERTPELIFKEFEEDTNTRYSHRRVEKINEAKALLEAQGRETEKQQAVWESALVWLHVRDSSEERKRLGGRFGPMCETANGGQSPDPAIFTDEALDYYAKRAAQTSNPIHRARYCDFIWEKRRDHKFARKAIDAYLECVPIYLDKGWHQEAVDGIERATELALRLNDSGRTEKVRERLLETMNKLATIGDDSSLRECIGLVDAMLEIKGTARDSDLQEALGVCRKGAAFYVSENSDDYGTAREFEERQASLWERLGNSREANNARVRIGDLLEKEADLRSKSDKITGAAILEKAVQHYANIGRSDKVEELKVKVKQRWQAAVDGGEFGRIGIPVRLPTKQIDQCVQDIVRLGTHKALLVVSLDYLNLVPDIEQCRKAASEQKQEFPLLGLIPRVTLRGDRQVASTSTQEEIDEANALLRYKIDWGLSRVCLSKIFEMLRQDSGLTADSLVSYVSASPFFDEDKLEMIRVGIERYFAGDHVSAIHVLVPHLEDVLRRTIGRLGVSTTSRGADGLTREKSLDVVLDTDELKSLLGDRVWFYFKYVLSHQLGENLRNDVAHGLIDKNRCTSELAVTVLHLILLLTPYREGGRSP